MKILRDEPQQLLVLEAPGLGIPRAVGPVVKLVVFGVAVWPMFMMGASTFATLERAPLLVAISLGFCAIWGFAALRILAAIRRAARFPLRLRVDRYAAELEIEEEGLLDGRKAEVFRLDRLRAARVATALAKPSPGEARSLATRAPRPGVRIAFELLDDRERALRRELTFVVEHLDKREEVADLAYRLARAAGLPYSRVLRSDPRELEIELLREAGQGTETVPLVDGPADYSKDRVMAQAARTAAQEKIAAFAPDEFQGPARVAVWLPRQEVRFAKPLGFAAIGCLPFVLLVLGGPAMFLLMPARGTELGARVGVSAFVGLFGLIVGLVAAGVVYSSLPRRVTLDWSAQSLEVAGLLKRSSRPLTDIGELELKCVRTFHRGGKNSSAYNSYRCDVVGHMRGAAQGELASEVLIATEEFREAPETPYRMSLPLVAELADALGVKRRVTDYA